MSTLHRDQGRADADTAKGELRKPHDYSDQPGADGVERADAVAQQADESPDVANPTAAHVGKSSREYGHSSGDCSMMRGAGDWDEFQGGAQRDATADAPRDPAPPPDHGTGKRGGGPSAGSS